MALSPKQQQANKLTLQIIGATLIVVGLWAWRQPGDSVLILGLLIGPFLLIAPNMFLH